MEYSLAYEAQLVNRFFWHNGIRARVVQVRAGESVNLFVLELAIDQKSAEIARRTADIESLLNRYRRRVDITVQAATRYDQTTATLEINAAEPKVLKWRKLLPQDPFVFLLGERITPAGRRIVSIDLRDPGTPHILLSGTTGSGKTNLLSMMVASIAATTPPQMARMLLIDLKGNAFTWAEGLPQVEAIITSPDEASVAIQRVVSIMHHPRIDTGVIVFIDEAARLMQAADAQVIQQGLAEIAAIGRERHVHLVVATQHPNAQALAYLVRANLPVRIAGRVMDAAASAVALGVKDANAHRLPGRGAFLMNANGELLRFQAWLLSEEHKRAIVRGAKRRFKPAPPLIFRHVPGSIQTLTPGTNNIDDVIRSYARADGTLSQGWLKAVTTLMNGGKPPTGRVYKRLRANAILKAQSIGLKPT